LGYFLSDFSDKASYKQTVLLFKEYYKETNLFIAVSAVGNSGFLIQVIIETCSEIVIH
jgi:hypothetical protein